MSQRELAEKISVTQTTISNWEKNPESISGENLKKVALFFRVSTDELLGIKVDKNF